MSQKHRSIKSTRSPQLCCPVCTERSLPFLKAKSGCPLLALATADSHHSSLSSAVKFEGCCFSRFRQLSTKAGQQDRQTSLGVKVSWEPEPLGCLPSLAFSARPWTPSLTPERLQRAEGGYSRSRCSPVCHTSHVLSGSWAFVFKCVFGVRRPLPFPWLTVPTSYSSCFLAWFAHLSSVNQLTETDK